MDFKRFKEQLSKEERNKALEDALQTRNPVLIKLALELGADPLNGGIALLEYAISQRELELVQRLVPTINDGLTVAMSMAIDSGRARIGMWLLKQGAVMQIDSQCICKHSGLVGYLMAKNPEANFVIQYEALEGVICLESEADAVLAVLLDYMKKNSHKDFAKWMVNLADYTVDTDRVDCMDVLREHGLDLEYVNTKYCSETMQRYLEEHGVQVSKF